jgi:signal transduction histidine kinase
MDRPVINSLDPTTDYQRLVHELQVYQVELEMHNTELRNTRDELETALDNYTDLYDFAPVGYFTLAADSTIQRVNLTGTNLVGIERSRLLGHLFRQFIVTQSRSSFDDFLERVFSIPTRQSGEFEFFVDVLNHRSVVIEAQKLVNGQACRVAVIDVTERKHAAENHRRLEIIAASNQKLEREIVRRQAVEDSLEISQEKTANLLDDAVRHQEELRLLSRQLLTVQEEERRKISRDLHDVISQSLTSIQVSLVTLKCAPYVSPEQLDSRITATQQLVESSLEIVHRFACDLRTPVLDDLGLIPALKSLLKAYHSETGIRGSITVSAEIEKAEPSLRTVLYRVAQEALINVARHARASHVSLTIHCTDTGISMEIADDGQGFKVEPYTVAKKSPRLGLLGMRERVEMCGGRFSIDSAPGSPTTVRVAIPIPPSPKNA